MNWQYIQFLNEAFPSRTPSDILLDEIALLFDNWDEFFNYYMRFAPPPISNQLEVKQKFMKVRAQYKKCVEEYHVTKIRCLNDIKNAPSLSPSTLLQGKKKVHDEYESIEVDEEGDCYSYV